MGKISITLPIPNCSGSVWSLAACSDFDEISPVIESFNEAEVSQQDDHITSRMTVGRQTGQQGGHYITEVDVITTRKRVVILTNFPQQIKNVFD